MPQSSGFYMVTEPVERITVDNKFTEITLVHLSKNGYSEVYKALRHGKWHILKRLTDQEKDNPRFQELLRKEFEISYQLSHPGIVHTLGMEEVESTPFGELRSQGPATTGSLGVCIVQEYIDGSTWDDFFHSNTVKASETRRIISELCLAIDYIHQRQIVHRDITPENILITRDGHHPVIIDFGLADRANFVYLKEPAGTSGYASPEQQQPGVIDNRSDIYSLGVLIDGVANGNSKTVPRRFLSLSNGRLHRIARKCLANNPEKRFVSAMEIHRMLEPMNWWRWITSVAFGILAAMAVVWFLSDSNQTLTIAKLKQQSLQQEQQSRILQQQIRVQQERIAVMKRSVGKMSSTVDSVQTVNNVFSRRIDREDSQAEALAQAKKELRDIANRQYQKIWDSHTELADHPKKRKLQTNNEIYLTDWHPIVARLVEKYHLDSNMSIDADKVLMDEWMIDLSNKVR